MAITRTLVSLLSNKLFIKKIKFFIMYRYVGKNTDITREWKNSRGTHEVKKINWFSLKSNVPQPGGIPQRNVNTFLGRRKQSLQSKIYIY